MCVGTAVLSPVYLTSLVRSKVPEELLHRTHSHASAVASPVSNWDQLLLALFCSKLGMFLLSSLAQSHQTVTLTFINSICLVLKLSYLVSPSINWFHLLFSFSLSPSQVPSLQEAYLLSLTPTLGVWALTGSLPVTGAPCQYLPGLATLCAVVREWWRESVIQKKLHSTRR